MKTFVGTANIDYLILAGRVLAEHDTDYDQNEGFSFRFSGKNYFADSDSSGKENLFENREQGGKRQIAKDSAEYKSVSAILDGLKIDLNTKDECKDSDLPF